MPKSASEREKEYRARMRAKGFALVRVWVPEGTQGEVKAFAAELKKRGPKPP